MPPVIIETMYVSLYDARCVIVLQYTAIDYVTYLSGYMSGLASQNYIDQRQNFHFFLPVSGIASFQFCEDFFIIKVEG